MIQDYILKYSELFRGRGANSDTHTNMNTTHTILYRYRKYIYLQNNTYMIIIKISGMCVVTERRSLRALRPNLLVTYQALQLIPIP
jgi:hypothetical protein